MTYTKDEAYIITPRIIVLLIAGNSIIIVHVLSIYRLDVCCCGQVVPAGDDSVKLTAPTVGIK